MEYIITGMKLQTLDDYVYDNKSTKRTHISNEELETLFQENESKESKSKNQTSRAELESFKDKVLASNSKLDTSDIEELDVEKAIKTLQEDDAATSRGISVHTEKKATMNEHREKESDFFTAFNAASLYYNGINSDLISTEDKTTLQSLAMIANAAGSNTYFLTDRLQTYTKNAKDLLSSMETSVKNSEDELNTKGESLLDKMKKLVIAGKKENNDDKTTIDKAEYEAIENNFNSGSNLPDSYNTLKLQAERFGCFA